MPRVRGDAGALCLSQQGVSQGAEGVLLCVSVGADGKAMKSPDVLAKATANGFGIGCGRLGGGGRWQAGWQLATSQGFPSPIGHLWVCREDAARLQGRCYWELRAQLLLTLSLPPGPGPQPVPSPAGSPGQHHGRHPGSPSPPGRGLLDSQATSRFTQGLLRLCVQASRPAGCSGPSS